MQRSQQWIQALQMRRPNADGGILIEDAGALPEIEYSSLEFYESLSSGTYGTVYRAKWKPSGLIVAVKRLLVLEKEAHILSLLRHRNIIQFFGAVTKPPNFCIVTEFAHNGSLYGYLHDKSKPDLSLNNNLQWAIDIASGVHYLHFDSPVAIVHRDLKSKNVVISSSNICKLCDFGTSKALAHTTRMSYVGTMAWMSPEMIQSMPVSESTDTWSYGVILWELFTREIPFEQLNEYRIAWMVVEKGVRLTIPTSCPEPLADLLRHCWETDRKSRPNFKDILKTLDEIRSNEITSQQTREFLENRNVWKAEIQEELIKLKDKEIELNDRHLQLHKWEERLLRREQSLNSRRRELPSYDVNVWTEQDVGTWLLKLSLNGVQYEQLSDLASAFQLQQITGERLLLLTMSDLANLGVNSRSLQWQLIQHIQKLKYDNRRLINFPPLSYEGGSRSASPAPSKDERPRRTSSPSQERPVELTLLFCVYIRAGPSLCSHKWKLLMDIDDDDDFLLDHPTISQYGQLITDVSFTVPTPPYIFKSNKYPYVMRDWMIGLTETIGVQCVVNFTDNVRQPRNTTVHFDIDYEKRGLLVEKRVQLYLRSSTPRSASGLVTRNFSLTSGTIGSELLTNFGQIRTGGVMHGSQSSPALAPAWQERLFVDAVPNVPSPPQSTKRSPLWSDIVSGLMQGSPPQASADEKLRSRISPNLSTTRSEHHPALPPDGSRSQDYNTSLEGVSDQSTAIGKKSKHPETASSSSASIESEKENPARKVSGLTVPVTPKRRGGRVRYSRNRSSGYQGSSGSVSITETNETINSSSPSPERNYKDGLQDSGTSKHLYNEQGKQQTLDSSSAMSVQVHGGYPKWKWKN